MDTNRLRSFVATNSFLIRNSNETTIKRAVFDFDIEELLLWLCGFLGTMPILTLFGNTLFVYMLLILTVLAVIRSFSDAKNVICIKKQAVPVTIMIVLNIISGVYCIYGDMPEVYRGGMVSTIIIEALFSLYFIIYINPNKAAMVRVFLKGIYVASVFQLLFCLIQIAYEHITGNVLNEVLFRIEISNRATVTGLCWHPSNLAPLFVFGCFMSKSPLTKAAFMAVSLIIGNRTAVLGVAVVIFLELVIYLYVNRSRFKVNTVMVVLMMVSVVVVTIAIFKTSLGDVIKDKFSLLAKKIDNGISSDIHAYYWTSLPELLPIVSKWDNLYPIIGVGPGNSGYIMTRHRGMYPGIRWVLECDYVSDFWSYGILGFAIRYGFYCVNAVKSIKVDIGYIVFFIAFWGMGVTYNVMYGWCILLIYSCFILISQGESLRCDR